MNLLLYPLLSTCSKRSLLKTKNRGQRDYLYNPRGKLLERLATETGLSKAQVYEQLLQEREYLIKKLR